MKRRHSGSSTRILFVRPGEVNSGQLFAMDHFALEAARCGMEVGILGPFPDHPKAEKLTSLGSFPSYQGGPFRTLLKRLNCFRSVVQDFRPNLIHVRHHFGAGLLPGFHRFFCPGAKTVLDIRTKAPNTQKHRLLQALRFVNGKGYDHVFALNQSILDAYVGSGVPTSLLPLGFDDETFRPDTNDVRFEPGQRLRCIYYGSMNRVRGLETLLKGLILALESGVDLEANLVGEGDDKRRLEALIPPAFAERIRFYPFSDQKTLAHTLREHHLGLAYVPEEPIFDPNLPLKTVEMLASGLPVLATCTQGNRQVVQEGLGGILARDSPGAICDGLIKASRGEGALTTQAQVRATTVRDYAWSKLAEEYLFPVYDELING